MHSDTEEDGTKANARQHPPELRDGTGDPRSVPRGILLVAHMGIMDRLYYMAHKKAYRHILGMGHTQ